MYLKLLKKLKKIKKWLRWSYPRIRSAYEDMRKNVYYVITYLVYCDWKYEWKLRFWIIYMLVVLSILIFCN
jgi:hypothetical protein